MVLLLREFSQFYMAPSPNKSVNGICELDYLETEISRQIKGSFMPFLHLSQRPKAKIGDGIAHKHRLHPNRKTGKSYPDLDLDLDL